MQSTANYEPDTDFDTLMDLDPGRTATISIDASDEPDLIRVTRVDDGMSEIGTYKIVASYPIDFYSYAPASDYQTDWLDLREAAINEFMGTLFGAAQTPDSVGWTAMGYDFTTEFTGELTVDVAVEIGDQSTRNLERPIHDGVFAKMFARWISERVFADAAGYESRALSSQDIRGGAYAALAADADHPISDKVARAIAMAAAGRGRPAITKLAASSYVAYADLIGELDAARADVQNWDEANELIALGQWATAQHSNQNGK